MPKPVCSSHTARNSPLSRGPPARAARAWARTRPGSARRAGRPPRRTGVAAPEAHEREGVRGERGEHDRDDRGRHGDHDAVEERVAHVLGAEHLRVVAKRPCIDERLPPAGRLGGLLGSQRCDQQAEGGHGPKDAQHDQPDLGAEQPRLELALAAGRRGVASRPFDNGRFDCRLLSVVVLIGSPPPP